MTCPACSKEVAEGTAICPHCDAVLDSAAFEEPERPAKAGQKTGVQPGAPAKAAAAAPEKPAGPQLMDGPRPRRRKQQKEIDYSPDRVVGEALAAVQSLLPFDQVTLAGAGLLGLSLLMPWRFTQAKGDEMGLFGGGWPVALLLIVGGAALWLRTSDDLRGLRPDQLAGVQLLTAVGSLIFSVFYFFNAIDNNLVVVVGRSGTVNLKTSQPEAGIGVCALAAIIMGTGSIWAWMAERGT